MMLLPPISEQQLQALAGLIDAGLRATGIRAAKDAAALVEWLEKAQPMEGPKELEQKDDAA